MLIKPVLFVCVCVGVSACVCVFPSLCSALYFGQLHKCDHSHFFFSPALAIVVVGVVGDADDIFSTQMHILAIL